MKKQLLLSTALLTLAGIPVQSVVYAQQVTAIQQMAHYSVFENKEYGVTVKIDPGGNHHIQTAEIEVVSDKTKIQQLLKNTPKTLDEADFDLLLVHFFDSKGEPIKDVASEIQLETRSLRGDLEHVLYLTEDAGYKTLPFEKTQQVISFVSDKTHDFALVYRKDRQGVTQEHQKERLANIVAFSSSDNDTKKLEEIVAISTDDKKDEKKLEEIVAISSDKDSDKETKPEKKPEFPTLDVTDVVAVDKPADKDENKDKTDEKDTTTPIVAVDTSNDTPTVSDTSSEVVTQPEEKPSLPATPVEAVGTSVSIELPVFDWLADDDQDGFTNGTEATLLTDHANAESMPPLPSVLYKQANYFLNRASAEAFIDKYRAVDDSVTTFNIVEKTDEAGRTYFNIEFNRDVVTEQPKEMATDDKIDTASATEKATDKQGEETAPPATTDNKESASEQEGVTTTETTDNVTDSTDTSDTTPSTPVAEEKQPLPDGMSEALRERHEEFLRNGFEYRGTENGEFVYGKGDVNAVNPTVTTSEEVEMPADGTNTETQP